MTDGSIYLVIAGTFFGFIGLAFILLFPVWRFLHREERISDDWTDEAIAKRTTSRATPQDPAAPEDGA